MKLNIKLLIIAGIFTIIAVILLNNIISSIEDGFDRINETKTEYKSYLGNMYEIDSDTLIVIDYSLTEENFTMSNGIKVSYELITTKEKLNIK